MFTEDHLKLRLIKLKPSDVWLDMKDGLSFIFCTKGTGNCIAKSASHRLAPGDVLVLNGDSGARLSALNNSDFKFFSILLEQLFPLFGCNEISLLQNLTDCFKTVRIYPGGSPLALECQRLLKEVPANFNLEHRSQLLRIAAAVLSVEFRNAQTQKSVFVRPEDHTIHIFENLSAAELLNLSVGELASKFNCSRRHLNRLFHQHFGLSVAALTMEMRLLNAVNLLRDPQTKVINVAEQCGFNHLGLFNTCFKRRFGASPGQWRKLNLKTDMPVMLKSAATHSCPLQGNGLCAWNSQPEPPVRPECAVQNSTADSVRRKAFTT